MAIHIRRRKFLATLRGAAAAWLLAARAQERLRRVGGLSNPGPDDAEMQSRTAAFEQGLQELGWMVGRNLQIDYRWSNGNAERLRAHAVELMALQPDVVLATSGVSATWTAFSKARSRPIFLFKRRLSTSWCSTSRPPRRWALTYPPPCSAAPTR
jgi:putative tryptophan/tyrosine transport system substrate-binding protein